MKTIKEVAELTGVSVRTLQYYDEIGLLKPDRKEGSNYRLYGKEDLKRLQEILFFKELDFGLKEIRELLEKEDGGQKERFHRQRLLLKAKRDRLDRLLSLLEKLEEGEEDLSFTAFDMRGYFEMMARFRAENPEKVEKLFGSMEAFDFEMGRIREREWKVGKKAAEQYGSVENFTKSVKRGLEEAEKVMDNEWIQKVQALYRRLASDLTKDAESEEIQSIVREIVWIGEEKLGVNGGKAWEFIAREFQKKTPLTEGNDVLYGKGGSRFIGRAFACYLKEKAG